MTCPSTGGIEVLVGLSFVFFLLSTAASAIQEGLASILRWRAKTLEDAVGNMLGNPKVKRRKDEAVRTAVVAKVNAKDRPQQAADAVSRVTQLKLPIGWSDGNMPADLTGWLGRMPGWLLTIAALNLGAPFWFDLLGRISRQGARAGSEQPEPTVAATSPSDVDAVPSASRRAPAPNA